MVFLSSICVDKFKFEIMWFVTQLLLHIIDLIQKKHNSIAEALELRFFVASQQNVNELVPVQLLKPDICTSWC